MPDRAGALSVVLTATYGWPEVRRGGERYLHELAAALTRRGHRVRVLTTAPHASRGRVLEVPVQRVARPSWPSRRLGPRGDQLWFGAQALGRIVGRGVDVWHALTLGDAAAAGLAGQVGGPTSVFTALGVPTARGRGLAGATHRLALATVDTYVCLSERAATPLRSATTRSVEVVGAGVDPDRFVPGPARHDRPALLFASDAGAPQKNLALLLESCIPLVAELPDLELWLAGPGDPGPAVAAAPPAVRDRVTVARRADPDELADRYARAWTTVLPSRNEAFGMVALESLASGTPAVVLAGEGPASFVDDGVGAVVAPEPAALAAGCRRGLELAAHPGTVEACRTRALAHAWDDAIAPAFEALYSR